MAHLIDFTKQRPAIAYVGNVPWHGLGQQVNHDLPLKDWIVAAGLNYEVEKKQLFTRHPDISGAYLEIPSRRALVRDDTDGVLAVVSDRYQPVQPREVVFFFERLVNELGFRLDVAGALSDGKRVWALAKTNRGIGLTNDDVMETYLLLATSYDGQLATTARYTSVRVVCNNTLELAYGGGSRVVSVPHSTEFKAATVHTELNLLQAEEQFGNDLDLFATKAISRRQAIDFLVELLNPGAGEDGEIKVTPTLKTLTQLLDTAPGHDTRAARGTVWGTLNTVTYFCDHVRRARNDGTRLNSSWFGESERLKKRAYDLAKEAA